MNILGALNMPLPEGSAGVIHWVNTTWHLAEAGATVKLLGGISPCSRADEILEFYGLRHHPRLSIVVTRPWSISSLNRSPALRARAYFLELVRQIRIVRPDVLFGIGMPNHMGALGLLKKLLPFRVVLELHESHCTNPRLEKCLGLLKGASPHLDGVITVSPAHRDLLIGEGVSPDRVHTFPAVFRPDLVRKEEKHALLKGLSLPIPEGSPIVIYGGNLYGDRGVENLLTAFTLAVGKVPEAHLVVLGEGEPEVERRYLSIVDEKGLNAKVHFTGRVPPTAVSRYLAVADIGVVPNPDRAQWEYGSPIKLSEYLGAGLAVVATSLRTTADMLGPEKAAILVGPEAPEDMAEAIIRLLTDEDLRRSMREKALGVGKTLTYKDRAESIYRFLNNLTGAG